VNNCDIVKTNYIVHNIFLFSYFRFFGTILTDHGNFIGGFWDAQKWIMEELDITPSERC